MLEENLTYSQLSSSINPSFWSKLTELKLNVDRLEETERHIWGSFYNLKNESCPVSLLEIDSTAFNCDFDEQNLYVPFHGRLINKNTIEQFKEQNKTDLINREGALLVENIKNGKVLEDPSLLNVFLLLSFADLKKYHYYYWFAYPVPSEVVLTVNFIKKIDELPLHVLSGVSNLYNEYVSLSANQKTYFIIKQVNANQISITNLFAINEITVENHHLYYFAFYDIEHQSMQPGSQLRNYVAFILHHCAFLKGKLKDFIGIRLKRQKSQISFQNSIIYSINLPAKYNTDCWVGWEKNERGKMGPRLANMKNNLDPMILAESSIDLNLKLMKWRLLPEINLDKIKCTKFLLLGSGTLGCSVARTLLAWGVRTITFVDNSTVSFSNPVRQSLFTYQDSVDMKPKSKAAADGLKRIFPNVNAKGVQLNIPMPGHCVGESLIEATRDAVKELTGLIQQHDVLFLLMDSRESRWLPTLLGKVHRKIVVNAALGFDTYLVMRHGGGSSEADNTVDLLSHPEGFKCIAGNELGCYFCNDVTAPGNSTKDRTLDQQCTVTRPGVSQIAGALAVELAISILQHKLEDNAPAFYQIGNSGELGREVENQCILGLLPHSIRGFLSSFTQVLPATQRYKQCIACSDLVLNEYKEKGDEFLFMVFNSSKHLEDVAGLSEMFKNVDYGDVWELSYDDED